MIFNFLGNFLVGISYILTSGISGAATCFVACIQVLVNYGFNKRKKNIPMFVIVMHATIFVGLNIFTFRDWYDILALIAALIFVFSVAQSSSAHYRILYFSNSMVWIFYDCFASAYGNLMTHIVLMLATFVAILLRDSKGYSKN